MFRKILSAFVLLFVFTTSVFAQFYPTQYRPPDQNWQFLQTPHFKLIYAKGNDSTALQMGQILEQQYPLVQELVGGELHNFPVILNDYNDRSNGFVTPLHFRSEIELPPIKGKTMNPQTGGWLKTVGPHELVHALQFSNLGDYNIPRLVSLFSPDLARSFHSAIHPGITEGIAVYHETKNVAPDGGRGNYPFFTNQFDAIFKSDLRWSMGQMVQPPSRTRPFGRHYIGGYEFTAWLQNEFGTQTTQQALDFYMDFPFLGYGVALRNATGFWPGQLYNRFEKAQTGSLDTSDFSYQNSPLHIPLAGCEIRRPKWLSESKLIFHGSFYNARPGFYTYNLKTDELERLITTHSVSDYRYDLSADNPRLVYSYYEAHPIYDNTAKAELVQYDFSSGESQQITKQGRSYAPLFMDDSLLALQTRPAASRLISLTDLQAASPTITEIASPGNYQITAVDDHPHAEKLAIIINKKGMQALWITGSDHVEEQLRGEPDIAFSRGSVFDPEWHPGGQKLLFSSDFSGTHQLYEYDLEKDEVVQITGGSANAFEGSYSPDGNRIAYIRQVKNERLPVILNRKNFLNKTIREKRWKPTQSKLVFMQRAVISDSIATRSADWESGRYSPVASWLKPRTVLPVIDEIGNRDMYRLGLSIHSNNTLTDQAYSAEFSYFEQRGWYDLTYQNKTFFPGFKARLYHEPSYRTLSNIGTLLREERSLAFSVPFRLRLNQNVYNTSLFVEPEIRRSQIRFLGLGGQVSNFSNVTIGNISTQFNYRLQQNIRDLQPNSGLILFSEVEHLSHPDNFTFSGSGSNITISTQGGTALQAGVIGFLSPLRRWNQSLRLDLWAFTQSSPIFDNQSLVSDAFSEPVFPTSNNLLSFDTRYTIPLTYVDNGGFLLPFYLSNIHLVAFSNTVTDPTLDNWYHGSRSVFGLGIRAQFRIGNLGFNLGVAYGYEPTRKASQFFIGNF